MPSAEGIEPDIWSLMRYTPPRGPCNQKESLLSSRCSCQRFMIHPVKAATSYDCDGCGHHASFHSLENKAEEEILKKWKTESAFSHNMEILTAASNGTTRGKKRPRTIQATASSAAGQIVSLDSDEETATSRAQRTSTRGGGNGTGPGR